MEVGTVRNYLQRLVIFVSVMLLTVNCLFEFFLFYFRRFVVKHSTSFFLQYSCTLEFLLVAAKCAVYGRSFFYSDD